MSPEHPIWASPAVINRLRKLVRANEHLPGLTASRHLTLGIEALIEDLETPSNPSLLELLPAAANAAPYVWHSDAQARLYRALGAPS